MSYKKKVEEAFREAALIAINGSSIHTIAELHNTFGFVYDIHDGKCVEAYDSEEDVP